MPSWAIYGNERARGPGPASIGGSGFDPSMLPNLLAWFKADAGASVNTDGTGGTPANTGTVGRWTDQSGNGHHFSQGTAGNRPTFLTAGFNGLPCINFIAANNTCLDNVLSGGITLGANTLTAIGYFQLNSATANFGRLMTTLGSPAAGDDGSNGNISYIQAIRDATNDTVEAFEGGVGARSPVTVGFSTGAKARIASVLDTVNVTTFVNNSAGTPQACAISWGGGLLFRVGCGATIGNAITNTGFQGTLVELIYTTDTMTAPNLALVDSYLTAKWGT